MSGENGPVIDLCSPSSPPPPAKRLRTERKVCACGTRDVTAHPCVDPLSQESLDQQYKGVLLNCYRPLLPCVLFVDRHSAHLKPSWARALHPGSHA